MALTLYLILAILSSWIWVDYFKNIGLADKNKQAYRYLTFALGAGAYYLFHIIANRLLGGFEISWQNKILGNLFNSIVKIGLIGEVVKIIPIFIVYYLILIFKMIQNNIIFRLKHFLRHKLATS